MTNVFNLKLTSICQCLSHDYVMLHLKLCIPLNRLKGSFLDSLNSVAICKQLHLIEGVCLPLIKYPTCLSIHSFRTLSLASSGIPTSERTKFERNSARMNPYILIFPSSPSNCSLSLHSLKDTSDRPFVVTITQGISKSEPNRSFLPHQKYAHITL